MLPDDSPVAADSYTKVLQGRYELGRVLGRGGSSKVYLARDVRTGIPVAVKAIWKPHHPCSPEAATAVRRSVEREVTALCRMQGHPHVVRLLDVLASRSTVYLMLELTDFGLCAFAGQHLGADGLAAMLCGSSAYVAPEIQEEEEEAATGTHWDRLTPLRGMGAVTGIGGGGRPGRRRRGGARTGSFSRT